jgi:hypothetical protein
MPGKPFHLGTGSSVPVGGDLRAELDDLLPEFGPGSDGRLQVYRNNIKFHNPDPDRVDIEILIVNRGHGQSAPDVARVMAAPFGAFVPWRPLVVFPAPPLPPRRSALLRTVLPAPSAAPLGPPDRVAPRRLLTALEAPDEPPVKKAPKKSKRLKVAGTSFDWAGLGITGSLPPDPLQLLGRGSVHWAGNLNVFLGRHPVERHVAQALRVYPGRVNMAVFFLGSGPDAYTFHLEGSGAAWNAALYDMTDRESLVLNVGEADPLEQGRWIEVSQTRVLALALRPPEGCGTGSVEVHVRQRSTTDVAVVEFSLDPDAAGPGCYTL